MEGCYISMQYHVAMDLVMNTHMCESTQYSLVTPYGDIDLGVLYC